MKAVKKYIFSLVLLFVFACKSKQTKVSPEVNLPPNQIINIQENSKENLDKPYVILISLDGFRYDYAERYGATNLLNFDIKANELTPVFPSKTFPNHYSIATGLYPGNHGLVSNSFYVPSMKEYYKIRNRDAVRNKNYYKGTPLWVLASQQKMVSASMFWVGSEAPIQDIHPNYYFNFDNRVTYNQRVNQIVQWLKLPEKTRPHFITLYFSLTDSVGHKYGPNSQEIADAVKQVDATIGDLMTKTKKLNLPINFVVVSDHGMQEIDIENYIYYEEMMPEGVTYSDSFPLMIYSDDTKMVDSLYTSFKKDARLHVYKKTNMPKHYNYSIDDERIGDLILQPKPPYSFGSPDRTYVKGVSTHGYDPAECETMGGIFYASGPAFKKKMQLKSFENIHIFPLISEILDLDYEHLKIDGKKEVLEQIIKN